MCTNFVLFGFMLKKARKIHIYCTKSCRGQHTILMGKWTTMIIIYEHMRIWGSSIDIQVLHLLKKRVYHYKADETVFAKGIRINQLFFCLYSCDECHAAWNFFEMPWFFFKSMKHLLNTLETTYKHPWHTLETTLKLFGQVLWLPWDTLEAHMRHPRNTLKISLKYPWIFMKTPCNFKETICQKQNNLKTSLFETPL